MTAPAGTASAGTATARLQERFDAALMGNYGLPTVALVRGEGCTVWDADGNAYLDLIAGIAVSALGHAHPAIVAAVTRQVATLAHASNLFLHEPEIRLAERLLALLGAEGRVFFCNSGAEANEAAVKLVRKHAGPRRRKVVAAEGSFHGRTMGALALTGKPSIRDPFAPFGIDVRFLPYGDVGRCAPPSPRPPPPCSWSRHWARAAWCRPRTAISSRPARCATRPERSLCSTRCRAGSGAPARGSRTSGTACCPTS
jgi:4-aminobutyrate aminotransferase-like enzyme